MKKSAIIVTAAIVLCLLIVGVVIILSNNNATIETPLPVSTESSEPGPETDILTSPVPTLSSEPSQSSETSNSNIPIQTSEADVSPSVTPEALVLVNEQDDKKGLIYLGLSWDELIKILDENDIGHTKIEDSEGSGDYIIESGWNNGYLVIFFDGEKDLVDGIDVSGPAPVQVTSTQKGLNVRDTFEKMVELYGNDYVISFIGDEEYQIYSYKFSDHYFEVWFQSDVITSWRITK